MGNTVDVANARYTNAIGAPYLQASWTDPDFDAAEPAFYYVRVLEIPTPKWIGYDAKFYGFTPPKGARMFAQERAYTSPIWYTPRTEASSPALLSFRGFADACVMFARLCIGLAVVAAVAVAASVGWIAAHSRDLPEPGDADLILAHEPLEPERNALVRLERAAALVSAPDGWEARVDLVLDGGAEDPEWLEALAAANRPALAELEAALELPLQYPELDYDDDTPAAWFDLFSLSKLAAAEAVLLAGRGETGPALERALLPLRLGRALADGDRVHLVETMLGVSHQQLGTRALLRAIRDLPLSAHEARGAAARLDSLRIPTRSWERTWAGEYAWARELLLDIDARGQSAFWERDEHDVELEPAAEQLARRMPPAYLWQPNRTLARYAELYRTLQAQSALPCAELPPPADAEGPARLLLRGNYLGNVLFGISSAELGRFHERRCDVQTRISLAQVALAARAYARERGGLPDTLDALVPRYLDAPPRDHFDDAPVRYAVGEARAWSPADARLSVSLLPPS